MTHVFAGQGKNISTAMAFYDDEITTSRYKNSPDTVNLLDDDTVSEIAEFERTVIGKMRFLDLLANLPRAEWVALALCLYIGLRQADVARILHVNPSTINRWRIAMGRVLLDEEEMQEKDW